MNAEQSLVCRINLSLDMPGHLATVKNQVFLLNLMPEILKKRANSYLLLLGEGEVRSNVGTKNPRTAFGKLCPHDRKCPQRAGLLERDGRFRFPVAL